MGDAPARLDGCLQDVIEAQERLLAVLVEQRPAIIHGRHREVEALSHRADIEIRRLAVAERARVAAAQALADERAVDGGRWSSLRPALAPDERDLLEPAVLRVEELVRDLEMANAVNGQLVRQELEVMDASMRSLGDGGPPSYTAAGARADSPPPRPMMLNTAA